MFLRGVFVCDAKPDDVFAADHGGGHVELAGTVDPGQQILIESVVISAKIERALGIRLTLRNFDKIDLHQPEANQS